MPYPILMTAAGPIPEQIAFVLLLPPIVTLIWWTLARGWAYSVQGSDVSERTKKRQKWEFWVMLILIYGIVIVIAILAHLKNPAVI
jgi:hypothetical protein